MKVIRRILVWLIALLLVAGGSMYGASELGGEVVTVHTHDGARDARTRLWVVDDGGYAFIRAGNPKSAWLARIESDPEVVVERKGVSTRYRAVPVKDDASQPARINALMSEKYGIANRIVSLLGDRSKSVAVRLEPVSGEPAPPS